MPPGDQKTWVEIVVSEAIFHRGSWVVSVGTREKRQDGGGYNLLLLWWLQKDSSLTEFRGRLGLFRSRREAIGAAKTFAKSCTYRVAVYEDTRYIGRRRIY
jgi:hypothetical protein